MDRTQIDGRELEYEVRGAGEPILLVHGYQIADAFARPLAQAALSPRYRLILYHRRRFAASNHPDGPLSIAQQAPDCRALVRHVGAQCGNAAGHSYGGAIALQLALDTPEARGGGLRARGRKTRIADAQPTGHGDRFGGLLDASSAAGTDLRARVKRIESVRFSLDCV